MFQIWIQRQHLFKHYQSFRKLPNIVKAISFHFQQICILFELLIHKGQVEMIDSILKFSQVKKANTSQKLAYWQTIMIERNPFKCSQSSFKFFMCNETSRFSDFDLRVSICLRTCFQIQIISFFISTNFKIDISSQNTNLGFTDIFKFSNFFNALKCLSKILIFHKCNSHHNPIMTFSWIQCNNLPKNIQRFLNFFILIQLSCLIEISYND